MYLPNAQYIPTPFKQSLKANPKTAQASHEEAPVLSKSTDEKPDIVAAESTAKHQTHNDGIETALLLLLLMDGIH